VSTVAGLCARCVHCKVIQSDRGSIFYQCLRSFTQPEFPKYPRLPVYACRGYESLALERPKKASESD
jgi:hypothetical protein